MTTQKQTLTENEYARKKIIADHDKEVSGLLQKYFPIPVSRLFNEELRLNILNTGHDIYVLDPRAFEGKSSFIQAIRTLDGKHKAVKGVVILYRLE